MGKKLEIKQEQFRRGIHTAYVGDDREGHDPAGNAKRMGEQRFLRGRADEVSVRNHELVKGAGLTR